MARGAKPYRMAAPHASDMARFDDGFGRRFLVTIDTEEDFDWSAPFSRDGFSLESTRELARCQAFFEGHGVAPLYLVDYPITQDATAIAALRPGAEAGRLHIGLQLHPWVNPPHDEAVTRFNSFVGNLSPDLAAAKLRLLQRAIVDAFGVAPNSFRAGRYGLADHILTALVDIGIDCDTSARSGFTYHREGGPDYRRLPLEPWWTGPGKQILELPLTTTFAGVLREFGRGLYHRVALPNSLSGAALARLGIIERIALTPEGIGVDSALRAVDIAAADGLPILNLSFHSPSLMPGKTPYVRDEADRTALYAWWDAVIARMRAHGYTPATIDEIRAAARHRA